LKTLGGNKVAELWTEPHCSDIFEDESENLMKARKCKSERRKGTMNQSLLHQYLTGYETEGHS
jgi:hypothetical protein